MSTLPDISAAAFNARATAFLDIHRATPSHSLITNVRTRIESMDAGAITLPVTVNDNEPNNAWVCSPYTTYCRYAREEIDRVCHPLLAPPLHGLGGAMGRLLQRARIDRHVAINNWLVSTNSYPRLADTDIHALINEARLRWPDHAIWFRSLNDAHHRDWLRALQDCGGVLLPSRQVYLFDNVAELARRHADLKRDIAWLLRGKHGMTCVPLGADAADFVRAEALYTDLYIDKYCPLNPQYRHALLQVWSRADLLQLHGIRDADNVLQGVVGMLRFGNTLTSPIVGYNTRLPQKLGLYRRLAACVLHEAAQRQLLVNLSAGVAHFKRQRGGRPAIEYSVVFVNHLPARRRHAVRTLAALARHIGVPVMRAIKA